MKNLLENRDTEVLPQLSQEVIFHSLKHVPAKYLHDNLRYVCKDWHNIISSNKFIAQNILRTKPQLLIVVPTCTQWEWKKVIQYQAHVLELEDVALDCQMSKVRMRRMGMIRSSCNGLILVDNPKQRGLLHVMNLLTKCCVTLSKCSSSCLHKACGAALGFDPCRQQYKVVHMYADGHGFEIFTLGCSDNAWKRVPGPFEHSCERPFDIAKFRWRDPVSINGGVLHWYVASNDYIISMNISDEKSIKTYLPNCAVRTQGCRYALLEMGGNLGLVYTVSITQIDVWILKDFPGKNWIKRHSIMAGSTTYVNEFKPSVSFKALPNFMHLFAVAALRRGEVMIFKHKNDNNKVSGYSYLYDIKKRMLKKVRMKIKSESNFIPHRDGLVCWKNEGGLSENRPSSDSNQTSF